MNQIEVKDYRSFKIWYKNNIYHRDGDLPAVEYANGCKEYWKKGKRHRDDDLPAVDHPSGYKEYWKDGIQYDLSRKEKIQAAINIALDGHPKDYIIKALFEEFKIDPNKMGYSDLESIPWDRNIELYDIAINLIAESIEMNNIK